MRRKTFLFILILFYGSFWGDNFFAKNTNAADSWEYVVINNDTTWSKGDYYFENPILIENGATLVIEKGSRIFFKKNESGSYLDVMEGNIIAEGTMDEPIVFSPKDKEDAFHIYLTDYAVEKESVFRFVHFENGGINYDESGQSAFHWLKSFKEFFYPTALADYAYNHGVPTVYYDMGKVRIENSIFSGSKFADITINGWDKKDRPNSYMKIINSNFSRQRGHSIVAQGTCLTDPMYADCFDGAELKRNWYGGQALHYFEDYDEYLIFKEEYESDPVSLIGVFEDRVRDNEIIRDPLIVIPGIMGSAKFMGAWRLDPITHVYDDLWSSLKVNGYVDGEDLFSFPYDWRISNYDTAKKLGEKIRDIRKYTGSSRIDVVAHSMGGLVARAYIEELGGIEYENDIDSLITVGTPHFGSPEAYLKWEAGEGFFSLKEKIAEHHFTQEAEENGYNDLHKYIQEKTMSVRELLPVYDYLFDVDAGSMRPYAQNYPQNHFLEELNNEDSLKKMHEKVSHINISGDTEVESTISVIRVGGAGVDGKWQHGIPENFYDSNTDQGLEYGQGDETVPVKSANINNASKVLKINSVHNALPTKAQCLILGELIGTEKCKYVENSYVTNILMINVFSPIDIQVVAPNGERIGRDFESSGVLSEIPGAFYSGFDTENEFITIPNPMDGDYKVITQGTDDGDWKIRAVNIREVLDDKNVIKEETLELVGIAKKGLMEENPVVIKDGIFFDNGVGKDDVPPLSTASISTKKGLNGWYLEDVKVSISVQDNEGGSGPDKVMYSLDNGSSWQEYAGEVTISTEGLSEFIFYATDKAGNVENPRLEKIKLDKTAPEAIISFDYLGQKLLVKGEDNLSKTTVSQGSNVFTIRDEAGHMTNIIFAKEKEKNRRISKRIEGISYDNRKVGVNNAALSYKWNIDRKKRYNMFASHLRAEGERLESHYLPLWNVTLLMQRPQNLDDGDKEGCLFARPILNVLNGMIIPGIKTDNGSLKIVY